MATPTPRTVEVVDPRWLFKAAGLVLLAALVCGYLSLCVLFWQGQWQLALHPSAALPQTPAIFALQYETVRFGPTDASGKPQLAGWFLPSDSTQDPTVLILHSGDGNMTGALPAAHILHAARLNVLLFDYRGYGASAGPHPTQQRLEEDAASALAYLTDTRHIPLATIIPFGQDIGSSLAVTLCAAHHELPALILDDPAGDLADPVAHDPRTRLIPVKLLFNQRFPLAAPLTTLATPKLIVTHAGMATALAQQAADPKMTVEFTHQDDSAYLRALRRFLDTYLTTPITPLSIPPQP